MNTVTSELVLGLLSALRPMPRGTDGEDFILASYPKSGNTWVRFIFAHLVANREQTPGKVNFHTIERYSPAIGGKLAHPAQSAADTNAARPIKTHYNWSFRYAHNSAVLLVRDPTECVPAFYDYLATAHGVEYASMGAFLGSIRHGLPAWISFHRSWRRRAAFVLRYEDILTDPERWVSALVAHLGLPYSAMEIERALAQSSRVEMKEVEKKGDPYHDAGYTFVRGEGEIRQKTTLTEADRMLIENCAGPLYEALRSGPGRARSRG